MNTSNLQSSFTRLFSYSRLNLGKGFGNPECFSDRIIFIITKIIKFKIAIFIIYKYPAVAVNWWSGCDRPDGSCSLYASAVNKEKKNIFWFPKHMLLAVTVVTV